jgi:transposase
MLLVLAAWLSPCRHFGISRETYYQWKRAYAAHGEKGLINSKPCPKNPKLRTPLPIEEKILYLRRNYHFGQVTISWYLARYHHIKISSGWGIQGFKAMT